MIVVDTNVLSYFVLPGDRRKLASAVARRDPAWLAPSLWRSELRNVLATAMRARGLSLQQALTAFGSAESLVVEAGDVTTEQCLEVAARGKISAYDAEFVAAAEVLDLRLITGDERLARSFPDRVVLLERFAAGE